MKLFFVLLVGFLAGFVTRELTKQSSALPESSQSKFKAFVKTEATNYAQLQDAEAKLKAADKMYGKMMVLFLAELGLRLTPPAVSPPVISAVPQIECPPVPACPVPRLDESASLQKVDQAGPKKNEKLSPKDMHQKFSTTPYVGKFDQKSRRMLGNFEGSMHNIAGRFKGRTDIIIMNFNLTQTGNEITGDTAVVMVDPNGKEYSRNSGNGGNRAIKAVAGEADSFFVEASPTSFFLLKLKHYPQITGEYYDNGVLIGKVDLRKTGL